MRKLVLITNDLYVRSFLQTDAFARLVGEDTWFAASEQVTRRDELEALPNYLGTLPDPAHRAAVYGWIRGVLQAAYRFRSQTQRIKIRQTPLKTRWRLKVQALPGLRQVLIARWLRPLGRHEELHALLDELRPDIVICPSAGTDALVVDAIRSARELRIRTLVLVNGWDNVASKTGFSTHPDYMAVWGEQSVDHAVRYHSMRRSHVSPIGVPTFRHHFAFDRERMPAPYPFPYVLFPGCALPFDELTALHALDDAVEQIGEPGLKVVYRPHPWRQARSCPDVFRDEDFRNVLLDQQVREAYLRSAGLDHTMGPDEFLPSLDYYPALIGHARSVVCPLSTMTVEAAIVERPVVVLAYDDGVHLVPPSEVAKFDHFQGIDQIHGFEIVRDLRGLPAALRAVHEDRGPLHLREQIRPWLYFDERGYDERLVDLLADIERELDRARASTARALAGTGGTSGA
jgi:hypothetical protein